MTWGKEDVLTENDFAGERTADTLTDSSITLIQTRKQDVFVIDSSKNYCFSVHIKKDDIEYRKVGLSLYFYNNSGQLFFVLVNTKTGEYDTYGGSSTIFVTDLDTHWRVSIAGIPTDPLDVLLDIEIWPAVVYTDPPGIFDWRTTGSAEVSNAQLTEGLEPHTYVKTTEAAVEGAVQNLLLWSEQFENWGGIGPSTVTSDTGSVPTEDRSWPAEDSIS